MSTTYKQAWVDIEAWDKSSYFAYEHAKKTFASRKWMIGCPVEFGKWYAGLLDFETHYLTQCCDTVWTKIDLVWKINDYSGLWYDLLAMVTDDAICLWAEVISISNTFETKKIEAGNIDKMMESLSQACKKQKIIISGWEIAEVWDLSNWTWWWADAIWIVEKDKVILWDNIKPWNIIISLQEKGFRCNWYSLVRKILRDNFWDDYYKETLAKKCALPSIVYHDAVLKLTWRYWEKRKFNIKGISHITWWWIPGNLNRVLSKSNVWAELNDLFKPPTSMLEIQKLWKVSDEESYKTWNMWNWMMIICKKQDWEKIVSDLNKNWIKAKIAWTVIKEPIIKLKSKWTFNSWVAFEFKV